MHGEAIIQYVRNMEPGLRDVITKRLVERRTFDEIGASLGVTPRRATAIFRNAVKELIRYVEWHHPKLVKRHSRPKQRGELC